MTIISWLSGRLEALMLRRHTRADSGTRDPADPRSLDETPAPQAGPGADDAMRAWRGCRRGDRRGGPPPGWNRRC